MFCREREKKNKTFFHLWLGGGGADAKMENSIFFFFFLNPSLIIIIYWKFQPMLKILQFLLQN